MLSSKKLLKYSINTSLVAAALFMAGCSSKEPGKPVSSSQINKIYKPNTNASIRNSKAMHRATLRPYTVFNVRYFPKIVNVGDEFRGIASWYGPNFHAKKTSNGETYNMYAMTAAHKTLPMNTMVKVDNLENGKSIIVRVNDRGPFVAGRIIDLSNTAAHKIDMVKKGTADVKITVLGYNGVLNNYKAPIAQFPKTPVKAKPVVQTVQAVAPLKPLAIQEKVIVRDNYALQVGAFGRLEGAQQTQSKYKSMYNSNVVIRKIFSNSRYLYKVYISGFGTRNQAQMFKDSNGLTNALVVGNIK